MTKGSLREFALAVYAESEVSRSCLLLQDRSEVDVNVVLYAAFVGVAHRHRLDDGDVQRARALVRPWHDEVVRPLRAVRRRLKTGPAPAPDQNTAKLRGRLQGLEIEAEIVELDMLGNLAGTMPTEWSTGQPAEIASANVELVIRSLSRSVESDEVAAISTIARISADHAPRDS